MTFIATGFSSVETMYLRSNPLEGKTEHKRNSDFYFWNTRNLYITFLTVIEQESTSKQ